MKYLFVILCEMISYAYCEKEYFKKKSIIYWYCGIFYIFDSIQKDPLTVFTCNFYKYQN